MARPVTLFTGQWADLSITDMCRMTSEFGYQGIEIWYAPIPIHNYGEATVNFRQIELTGTSIRGVIKAEIVVSPLGSATMAMTLDMPKYT